MPDSGAIDAAVVGRLGSDTTLLGLMPNGVHFDSAPAGSTKFVLVRLQVSPDSLKFDGRAFEEPTYSVIAIAKDTSWAGVRQAAKRIDELLEGVPLTVDGFGPIIFSRTERQRYSNQDPSDDVSWKHAGGIYEGLASAN